jgi:hypothetical protein
MVGVEVVLQLFEAPAEGLQLGRKPSQRAAEGFGDLVSRIALHAEHTR